MNPETKFAWNGDVALAYQVVGEGPIDLVYLQGYSSNVEVQWESPRLAAFLRGLSGFARLIAMDRRGWGCSDRFSPSDVPPFETLTDDLLAVMDAAGSERASIFASWECGLLAMLFAATHPDRTAGLVLCDSFAAYSTNEDTPWLPTKQWWKDVCVDIHDEWGTAAWSAEIEDEQEREWFTRYQLASIAPGALVAEFLKYSSTDVRRILPAIQIPTLVIGPTHGNTFGLFDPRNSRFLAERIPGATLVETQRGTVGVNASLYWYDGAEAIVKETGAFLAGLREHEASFDRVLATVLFTDIVDSTAQSAALGDRKWRELREQHDQIVRSQLARYRGREIKTMGDGFLATFDGPARAVHCAQDIAGKVQSLGMEIRAGLHTGEIEMEGDDVSGIGVAIGARVGALAGASDVLVSQTVKDLVAGSGLTFEDRGEHDLKGVPDRWHLYLAQPQDQTL